MKFGSHLACVRAGACQIGGNGGKLCPFLVTRNPKAAASSEASAGPSARQRKAAPAAKES